LATTSLKNAACGGESSSPKAQLPVVENKLPIIEVDTEINIDELTTAMITATTTDEDGTIVSYLWEQKSGTSVSLENSNTDTLTFTAPEVNEDTQLSFDLTVTDNVGDVSKTSVIVLVSNVEPVIANWMYEAESRWGIPVEQLHLICNINNVTCSWVDEELDITQAVELTESRDGDSTITFSVTSERVSNNNILPTGTYNDPGLEGVNFTINDEWPTNWRWSECPQGNCDFSVSKYAYVTAIQTSTGLFIEPIPENTFNTDYMTMNSLKNMIVLSTQTRMYMDGGYIGAISIYSTSEFITEIYNTLRHVYVE